MAAAPAELGTLEDALATAKPLGVRLVVQADLREREGMARVALRALDPESREIAAAGLGEAPLADLGAASEDALGALLPRLGIPASALPDAEPPGLDELAAAGRALAALDRGELAQAWLEVEGRLQPMAMQLRESILERAQRPVTPPAERARILAAAGDGAGAWQLIGPELERAGRTQDARILVAAAEVEIARRDAARAQELATAALRASPDDPDALLALGRAHELSGDAASARETL